MADNNNVDVERVDEYGDAPSVNSNGTDASQQQAQQTTQGLAGATRPNVNADAPETTMSFYETVGGFGLASDLSDKGKEFLNIIDAAMEDKNFASKYNWKIEVLGLSVINDSRAIIVNNKAVILIMSETNQTNENFPTIRFERKAVDEITRLRPGTQTLMTLVITPEDYNRASRFATYIKNLFVIVNRGQGLTLGMIRKDTIFSFADDQDSYERAYAEINPHAIPLRHDLCLTIYMQPKNRFNNGYGQGTSEADVYNRDDQSDRKSFATIGGYVEFIKDNAYGYKYMPVVHISEISARYPDEALIPLFLIIATKRFITARTWQMPYRQMRNDCHGNAVNLGALFPDGNGGRWTITRQEDFDKTIVSSFYDAQIVLDITEGRAMIPGLMMYTLPDGNVITKILQLYANTIGASIPMPTVSPFSLECPFYRGYYSFGSTKLDSANIDFLTEYIKRPNKASECEKLLVQKANPAERAAEDREFESDVKFYYRTYVIGLDPKLLIDLDTTMQAQNFQFQGLTQMNGIYNISGYKSRAEAWSNYQAMNNAGVFNNFRPSEGIYYY